MPVINRKHEYKNYGLNPDELEFTSDSCSIYFDYSGGSTFKIRIIGHIKEHAFTKMTEISHKILKHYNFSNNGQYIYYLVDLKYLQSISIRAINKIRWHQIPEPLLLVLYNLNTGIKNQLSLNLSRLSKSKVIIKKNEQEALKFLNDEQKTMDPPEEPDSIRYITTRGLKSWMIFDQIWEVDKEMIFIGGEKFRIIKNRNWSYTADDNHFFVNISVIESNIVLIKMKGFIKPLDIDHTYDILNQVIERLQIDNNQNKIYSIIDLRKLKGITLKARRKTALYESKFQQYSRVLIVIPSAAAGFFVRMLRKLYPNQFKLWVIMKNIDYAFSFLKRYHAHNLSIEEKYLTNDNDENARTFKASEKSILQLIKEKLPGIWIF